MKPLITIVAPFIIIALIGCNKEKAPETQESATPSPFSAQTDALNKAKMVEQVLQNGAEQEQENIKDQTQ